MKIFSRLITVVVISLLIPAVLILEAGGWDNFKLKYFFLTQFFSDQQMELADIVGDIELPDEEMLDLTSEEVQQRKLEVVKSTARIDLADLLSGGPPKDGIPSVDDPQFDTVATTEFSDGEIVIGVTLNGEAKAYPYAILNWHEIVNDTIGGVNVTVSLCPLCDTIVAFERGDTTFGVSGKLFQSCLVMYDRADDTLYSQPWAIGIVGPETNTKLKTLPIVKTTLGDWIKQHPDTLVMSTKTGYSRNYKRYPYGTYYTNEQIIFPARHQEDLDIHPKKIISYIWEFDEQTPLGEFSGDSARFIHSELRTLGQKIVDFADRQVRAVWDEELETVRVYELDGSELVSSTAFGFVYPAFFR